MSRVLTLTLVLVSGCAERRVSLRDLVEYDQAIKMADAHGYETWGMQKRFHEMLESYALHPAQVDAERAEQDQASAQGWLAASAMIQTLKPEQVAPPMSPGEFRRGR